MHDLEILRIPLWAAARPRPSAGSVVVTAPSDAMAEAMRAKLPSRSIGVREAFYFLGDASQLPGAPLWSSLDVLGSPGATAIPAPSRTARASGRLVLFVPERRERRRTVHAYAINLARSPERRAHITQELQKTGLSYEIVTGVDGRDLDLSDRTMIAPELLAENDYAAGAAGCSLSHLEVYRKVIADGREHAIVLEDDVTLPADLGFLVDNLIPHMTGAEVVLLNYVSKDGAALAREGCISLSPSSILALPIDVTDLGSSAAYVITRAACERMSERLLPVRALADGWGFLYQQELLDRVRCVLPIAVTKNAAFESTIGLYSLGGGVLARLVTSVVRRRIPVLHRVVLHRRQRILRRWERSEVVDKPFTTKPSRLA